VRSRDDDGQRTVLVVDDHAQLRHSLERLLERAGYRVLAAGNGAEGLARLRSGGVDVVVLDIDMPVMNGRAFLVARSADAQLARIPVVVYSADPRPPALPSGLTAWIWKGTESAELLGAIAAQVSAGRRR
jgi:CheY-like chemotaxis protein